MGFMWNIKQHKIDHKYSRAHYVLVDFKINKLKKATLLNSPQFCLVAFPPKQ
jgi:hypothetical protein